MLTQDHRFLKIHSPLGENKLILHRFSGPEEISRLFEYHLELISEDLVIDFDKILGQPVCVEMERESKSFVNPRYFHGHITGMRYFGELMAEDGMVRGRYKATMRPWLWFLTRTTDCRIFQDKDVKTIIEQIFQENGFTDYQFALSESYSPLEYCVQYRETDFNFVSRLMEQEGMVYFFRHEEKKHTLVVGDSITAHKINSEYANIRCIMHEGGSAKTTGIYRWIMGKDIISGEEVVLDDYDFEKPKVDLTSKEKTILKKLGPGNNEIFDYPGEYSEIADGKSYATKRMQELESLSLRAQGAGDTHGLVSGYKFKLQDHPREDQNNIDYLVLTVTHDIQSDAGITTAAGGDEIYYNCQFKVMPLSGPQKVPPIYKSPRITPKPIVQGPQTAVVVGSKDEEIWTDKYGRVKVQFHWDREGKKEGKGENMTCFLRVATAWAGQNWGTIHIPRIGQEVVVSFLEGDPDRPLVTGSVYNAHNMPPYTLPEHQTQSGIKSRSTKQGTDKNFNEIRFEDDKGKEELRIQAEKDMNIGVKQTRKTFIGSALKKEGTGDKHGDCPKVGTVIEQLTVFADRETFIKGNDTLQIAEESTASKGRCMTVHNGNHELTVKMGNQITKVKTGKIEIEAAQSIELKVGGSSIKLEPTKITIKSVQVEVIGDAQANMKAPMVEVNGSAMATLKGGLVMIN